MFTHRYKGYYIHGYFDKSECTVNLIDKVITVKSYRAAQLLITKWLKHEPIRRAKI